MQLAFIAAPIKGAQEAKKALEKLYPLTAPEEADVIVVLGGDGFMLKTLHHYQYLDKPVYGMNFGIVGFLMNVFQEEDLLVRLEAATETVLHPLKMRTTDSRGKHETAYAINEVALLRETAQAAKIRISVDHTLRLDALVCDGVLLSTPAGSTAYNLSAHGPIIPMGANLLALTPISAFRPRRWKGALLQDTVEVTLDILESEKRPVSAAADGHEVRDVQKVIIKQDPGTHYRLLYDSQHNLEERILGEQFSE